MLLLQIYSLTDVPSKIKKKKRKNVDRQRATEILKPPLAGLHIDSAGGVEALRPKAPHKLHRRRDGICRDRSASLHQVIWRGSPNFGARAASGAGAEAAPGLYFFGKI